MHQQVKKVITINDSKTSIQLCIAEWEALDEISDRENINRNQLIQLIASYCKDCSLTPMLRLFTIIYFRNLCCKIKKSTRSRADLKNIIKVLVELQ